MHFLYQIVTSAYIYSLYEEEEEVFLHVLNLGTKKSRDIMLSDQILDVLFFDLEVAPEDYDTVEELVSAYKHC